MKSCPVYGFVATYLHITWKGLRIPDLPTANAVGKNAARASRGIRLKTMEKRVFPARSPQGRKSYRLHFLIFNWKSFKNVVKQSILRFLPTASRRCLLPWSRPTAKGITGGAPGNVGKPKENNSFPRPQASRPSFAQSRKSYRLQFPVFNRKSFKTL